MQLPPVTAEEADNMSGRNVTVILLAVVALFLVSNSLFVIKETERGVLLQPKYCPRPALEDSLCE